MHGGLIGEKVDKLEFVFVFMRVRFLMRGGQRGFLVEVIERLRAPSLRGLLQFGFDVRYSTLKNYYNESRLMGEVLVRELCEVAGLEFGELRVELVNEGWGQRKGGEKSRK